MQYNVESTRAFAAVPARRMEEWGNEPIDARAGQRLALSLQFIAVRKRRRPLAMLADGELLGMDRVRGMCRRDW